MPVVTDLPAKLVLRWYSLNAQTLVFVWPDSIVGRSFVFRRPGKDDITGTIDGTELSFAVPAIAQKQLVEEWSLVETTVADTVLAGSTINWGLNYDDSGNPTTYTLTIGDGTTTVIVGVTASLSQETTQRVAADAALDARLDTLEADPTTATALAAEASARSTADALKVDKSTLTTDGDIYTRSGGAVTRMTRADLAADAAFTGTFVSATAADTTIAKLDPRASRHLSSFHAALVDASNAPCDIMCMGSSITEGADASSRAQTWPQQLLAQIRSSWQPAAAAGGVGYVPIFSTANIVDGWTLVSGTTPAAQEFGLGRRYMQWNGAGSATINQWCSGFSILYAGDSTTGSFSVSIDDIPLATVSTTQGAGVTEGCAKWDSDVLGRKVHKIVITPTSGADKIWIQGIMFYDGDNAAGVRLWEGGRSGKAVSWWESATNDYWYEAVAVANPDLIICEFGTGDFATGTDPAVFKATVQSIITKLRTAAAASDPSIVLLAYINRAVSTGPPPYLWDDYVQQLADIAREDGGLGFFDLRDRFGPVSLTHGLLSADLTHLTNKGSLLVGTEVRDALVPSRSGYTSPSLSAGGVPIDVNPITVKGITPYTSYWASDPNWTAPADGAGVASWRDMSNGKDLVQATGSKQPLYRASGASINDHPYIEFDGVNDLLQTAAFGGGKAQSNEIVAVFRFRSVGTAAKQICDGIASANRHLVGITATPEWAIASGGVTLTGGVTAPDTSWHYLRVVFGSPADAVFVDGIQILSGDAGTGTLTGLTLGATWAETSPAPIDVALFVFFDIPMTGDQRDYLLTWSRLYYGTP